MNCDIFSRITYPLPPVKNGDEVSQSDLDWLWWNMKTQELNAITGYVNAGGRGARLNAVLTPDRKTGITKALLAVGSPPLTLVEHQINQLLTAGVDNVVVGAGDHETVAHYIQARYTTERIKVLTTNTQLGNGGDLVCAVRDHPDLFGPHAAVVNVDTILDWDLTAVMELHYASGGILTFNLMLNTGVPNEGAFYVDTGARVLHNTEATHNLYSVEEVQASTAYRGSSTGALVVETAFLRDLPWHPPMGNLSLYKEIVGAALAMRGLFAYNSGKRFFIDVGTVETWAQVQTQPELLKPYLCY